MVASCATTSSPSPGSSAATPSEPPTATAPPTIPADFYGLANATLDVPLRPAGFEVCAQGPRTKFVEGRSGEITQIGTATEADVDHDGALDVVAGIDCSPGEKYIRQLVAFHRRPDGTFATIGIVVQPVESPDHETAIFSVFEMEITATGEVRVEVGDYPTIATEADSFHQGVLQFRTYGWNGTAFVQTAGSTSFVVPAGTVDLSLNSSSMTYEKPVNGIWPGTLTVTIRNNGANAVEDLSVQLVMGGSPDEAGCAAPGASFEFICPVGRLDPGTARTVTFHHSIPDFYPHDPIDAYANVQVRIGDQKYSDVQGVPLVYK